MANLNFNADNSTTVSYSNGTEEHLKMSDNETARSASDSSYTMPEELRLSLFVLIVVLSLFGVISNIINMTTFWKLRKEDLINLNLFGLSLSDFMVCLTNLLFFVSTGHWYLQEIFTYLKIVPVEVMYMLLGVPNSVSVRITVLQTASIAFQRCLCVVVPLKVKGFFTHSRITASVILSFIIPTVMITVPVYYVNRLQWVRIPGLNETILRVVMSDDFYDVNVWTTPINTVILLVIPFLIVSVSTAIMIKHLKQTITWRLRILTAVDPAWASKNGKNVSLAAASAVAIQQKQKQQQQGASTGNSAPNELFVQKEIRIIKLVLIVSLIFLVCYAPNVVSVMFVAFTKGYNIRETDDFEKLMGFVTMSLGTVNSSVNIFIYHNYSTNYRKSFRNVFCHSKR